jgi:hypothetical protein
MIILFVFLMCEYLFNKLFNDMTFQVSASRRSGNTAAASPLQTTKAVNNKSNQGQQAQGEKDSSCHFLP